jgi:dGTPase
MQWEKLVNLSRDEEDQPELKLDQKSRSIFEQDYDRIIFSFPFRCLQDKTQVFPQPKTDYVHMWLTRSLEVSGICWSLVNKVGQAIIGCHPDLVQKRINSRQSSFLNCYILQFLISGTYSA